MKGTARPLLPHDQRPERGMWGLSSLALWHSNEWEVGALPSPPGRASKWDHTISGSSQNRKSVPSTSPHPTLSQVVQDDGDVTVGWERGACPRTRRSQLSTGLRAALGCFSLRHCSNLDSVQSHTVISRWAAKGHTDSHYRRLQPQAPHAEANISPTFSTNPTAGLEGSLSSFGF